MLRGRCRRCRGGCESSVLITSISHISDDDPEPAAPAPRAGVWPLRARTRAGGWVGRVGRRAHVHKDRRCRPRTGAARRREPVQPYRAPSAASASATSARSRSDGASTNSSGVCAPPPRGPRPSTVSGIVRREVARVAGAAARARRRSGARAARRRRSSSARGRRARVHPGPDPLHLAPRARRRRARRARPRSTASNASTAGRRACRRAARRRPARR